MKPLDFGYVLEFQELGKEPTFFSEDLENNHGIIKTFTTVEEADEYRRDKFPSSGVMLWYDLKKQTECPERIRKMNFNALPAIVKICLKTNCTIIEPQFVYSFLK